MKRCLDNINILGVALQLERHTRLAGVRYPSAAVVTTEWVPSSLGKSSACSQGATISARIPVPVPAGALLGWLPRAVLPETEPGAGDGEFDCVVGTLRICARTWASCRSYNHAAC